LQSEEDDEKKKKRGRIEGWRGEFIGKPVEARATARICSTFLVIASPTALKTACDWSIGRPDSPTFPVKPAARSKLACRDSLGREDRAPLHQSITAHASTFHQLQSWNCKFYVLEYICKVVLGARLHYAGGKNRVEDGVSPRLRGIATRSGTGFQQAP